MDITLFEDSETVKQNTSLLDSLKKEFKIEAPLNFVQAYGDLYRNEKNKILNLASANFKDSIHIFTDNFKQFVYLDWQNILLEMIEKKSPCIFDFIITLKEKEILPQKESLKDSYSFLKYQQFISDQQNFNFMIKKDPDYMNRINMIGIDTNGQWKQIAENNKDYYIIALEPASYARSSESTQKMNSIDVSNDIVITKGLEYMSSISFDKIIFWEI